MNVASEAVQSRRFEIRPARQFVGSFLGCSVAIGILIFLSGWIIDPFMHFRSSYTHYPWGNESRAYSSYTLNRSLFKLIQYNAFVEEVQPEARSISILVGDSITNQIDPVLMTKLTGSPWFSIAYGKATIEENLELIDHLIERPEVGRIVWGLPFTRVRSSAKNEMTRSLRFADNPLGHLFTFESLRGVYYEIIFQIDGDAFVDPEPKAGKEARIARDIEQLYATMRGLPLPRHLMDGVQERIRTATDRGIAVIPVEWPLHPMMQDAIDDELADRKADYDKHMDRMGALRLADVPSVDDDASLFVDSLHLARKHKPLLSRWLADTIRQSTVEWRALNASGQAEQ